MHVLPRFTVALRLSVFDLDRPAGPSKKSTASSRCGSNFTTHGKRIPIPTFGLTRPLQPCPACSDPMTPAHHSHPLPFHRHSRAALRRASQPVCTIATCSAKECRNQVAVFLTLLKTGDDISACARRNRTRDPWLQVHLAPFMCVRQSAQSWRTVADGQDRLCVAPRRGMPFLGYTTLCGPTQRSALCRS